MCGSTFNLVDAHYYDSLIQSDGGRAVPGLGRTAMITLVYRPQRPDGGRHLVGAHLMLVTVEQALGRRAARPSFAPAWARPAMAWVDGRVTAGHQGAPVKFNQQIAEDSDVAARCQAVVIAALERNPTFICAVLPIVVYPPMFNRYGEGMTFGPHCSTAACASTPVPGPSCAPTSPPPSSRRDPDDYDGGELRDRGHLRRPQPSS